MGLYSDPPSLRDFRYDKPTLLVCWWVTLFCTVIILLRLAGRFIRTEKLFYEDKVAALALIPLYLRMGCVQVVLQYGTNNADFQGVVLTEKQLHDKQIASGVVLAARFFYAATYVLPCPPASGVAGALHLDLRRPQCGSPFCSRPLWFARPLFAFRFPLSIHELTSHPLARTLVRPRHVLTCEHSSLWTLKNTSLEFLKRLTSATWRRSHEVALLSLRWMLVVSFVACVISDLAECQPFDHYWQVLPDPGGRCRQAYVQLITMGVCNVVTDIMMVIFPVTIIATSSMSLKKKMQLILLFSLSLSVVGATLYRIPHVIWLHSRQQYRSLLASVELLFATVSANALVLGSFVRDRGIKKQKFHRTSTADSVTRSANRLPTLHRQWGSDEDIVREMGVGLSAELREEQEGKRKLYYASAPVSRGFVDASDGWHPAGQFQPGADRSDDALISDGQFASVDSSTAQARMSFFDVGGLLDDSNPASSCSLSREGNASIMDPAIPRARSSQSASGGLGPLRLGSTALLQDMGGLLGPSDSRSKAGREGVELEMIVQSKQEPSSSQHGLLPPVLQDSGGPLS